MSYFLGRVPVVRLLVRNPFSGSSYPGKGFAPAVVDTGYDGFLAVPEDVFRHLGLDASPNSERPVFTADGRLVTLRSAPSAVEVQDQNGEFEGMVETGTGVEEILAGARFLSSFRVTLNYCAGVLKMQPCG